MSKNLHLDILFNYFLNIIKREKLFCIELFNIICLYHFYFCLIFRYELFFLVDVEKLNQFTYILNRFIFHCMKNVFR